MTLKRKQINTDPMSYKDFNATYQCYSTILKTCSGICDFLMIFYKNEQIYGLFYMI